MNGRDIGEEIITRSAILPTASVAAGTGDATEIDGTSFNRSGLGNLYESCKLTIIGAATLASGLLITVVANLQDSANGSDWTDFGTALALTTAATGASGGSEVEFDVDLDNDIRPARQYLRAQVTTNLTATQTDTALVSGELVFGGGQVNPAT